MITQSDRADDRVIGFSSNNLAFMALLARHDAILRLVLSGSVIELLTVTSVTRSRVTLRSWISRDLNLALSTARFRRFRNTYLRNYAECPEALYK